MLWIGVSFKHTLWHRSLRRASDYWRRTWRAHDGVALVFESNAMTNMPVDTLIIDSSIVGNADRAALYQVCLHPRSPLAGSSLPLSTEDSHSSLKALRSCPTTPSGFYPHRFLGRREHPATDSTVVSACLLHVEARKSILLVSDTWASPIFNSGHPRTTRPLRRL